MPPTKKQSGPDTQPKASRGRRPGGRNRQNARGGRARRPKQEPVHNDPNESVNTWGRDQFYDTWGEIDRSGWGVEEQPSGWGQADDWASEAYNAPKIVAWARQVEACDTHDLARTPSATSDAGTTSSMQPMASANSPTLGIDTTPARPANPQLYRWALDFLERAAVSADHKRRALQFLNQSLQQQFEAIYALLEELRGA